MRREGRKLVLAEGHELPDLAKEFNEIEDADRFISKLKECRSKSPEEFEAFVDVLGKQIVD